MLQQGLLPAGHNSSSRQALAQWHSVLAAKSALKGLQILPGHWKPTSVACLSALRRAQKAVLATPYLGQWDFEAVVSVVRWWH